MRIHYIISITEDAILPQGEPAAMSSLRSAFGLVQEVSGVWYLQNRGTEKLYHADRPDEHPLTIEEANRLKADFKKERRTAEFYEMRQV